MPKGGGAARTIHAATRRDGGSSRNRGCATRFMRAEKVVATAGETAPVRDADAQTRGGTTEENDPNPSNSETRERAATSSS